MSSRLNPSQAAATLLSLLLLSGVSPAQSSSTFSLGDRIACQTAIEEVYWRHRESASTKPSFDQTVSRDVIQRKAEDQLLKSLALERYWGVTITGTQLQAELDRMAANSKAPDVLAELLAALDNDPQKAAECLARPLLVDRLIQTYYSSDARFHGALKAAAKAELAAGSLRNSSGQYREVEWRRGQGTSTDPGVINLAPTEFDERAHELNRSLAGLSGNIPLGRASSLREDSSRFYAVSVIWGGNIFSISSPIGSRYNPTTNTWSPVTSAGSPATRTNALSVWTGTEMIVWGGDGAGDGARYNPTSNSWVKTTAIGAPSPRTTHGVWTGSELVLWGGREDSRGGRYNPGSDSWRKTTRLSAPVEPMLGGWSAVWTGSQMIIWGGIIETQRGGLYCASGQPNIAPVAVNDSYSASAGRLLVVGVE